MDKAEKYERRWRNQSTHDVRVDELLLVLEANGFRVRQDRGHHYLAEHPGLADSPLFALPGGKVGRVTINAHAHGIQGRVHPLAVRDVLRALDHIRKPR